MYNIPVICFIYFSVLWRGNYQRLFVVLSLFLFVCCGHEQLTVPTMFFSSSFLHPETICLYGNWNSASEWVCEWAPFFVFSLCCLRVTNSNITYCPFAVESRRMNCLVVWVREKEKFNQPTPGATFCQIYWSFSDAPKNKSKDHKSNCTASCTDDAENVAAWWRVNDPRADGRSWLMCAITAG